MNIYQILKIGKLWFGLLIFVIVIIIAYRLLRADSVNYSVLRNIKNSTVTNQKQHQGCYAFDSQVTSKHLFQSYFSILNDSSWLTKPAIHSPSFQELHSLLFGSATTNLYEAWPNFFKKQVDSTYPHTSLTESLFLKILKEVNVPVTFVVEVGSFMGKSVTNMGKVLLTTISGWKPVILCIDTWLGGLEHWTESHLRQMMGIAYGRPIVYEQFIANIIGNNLTNYVIPYSTTSILGVRFLLEKKLFPQIVYLDSAHLQGETYVEIELYWLVIQAGGVLIGDDWSWSAVRCDVLRFVDSTKLNVTVLGNTWFIKKK